MSPGNPDTTTEELNLDSVKTSAQAGLATVSRAGEKKLVIEIQADISEAALANKHKRDRENATFRVMIVIGGALLVLLLAIIFLPLIPALNGAFTAEQRSGAITALISLFTGIVGYFTGSQIK